MKYFLEPRGNLNLISTYIFLYIIKKNTIYQSHDTTHLMWRREKKLYVVFYQHKGAVSIKRVMMRN